MKFYKLDSKIAIGGNEGEEIICSFISSTDGSVFLSLP